MRYFQIEIYEIISIYNSTRVECDERKNKLFFFLYIIAHYTLYTYTREDIDSFYDKSAFMHYEVEKIIFSSLIFRVSSVHGETEERKRYMTHATTHERLTLLNFNTNELLLYQCLNY